MALSVKKCCARKVAGHLVCCVALLAATSCHAPQPANVEDLRTHQNLSLFRLTTLQGLRDGDRLECRAIFSDSSSILTLQMQFGVGSPTVLQSGDWKWSRNGTLTGGSVSGHSITFLGGQDGPPSIGGAFDLLNADKAARYRVRIPVTELKARLRVKGDGLGSHP